MGGRGSSSPTSRSVVGQIDDAEKQARIKAYRALKEAGFDATDIRATMPADQFAEIAERLVELEGEYGITGKDGESKVSLAYEQLGEAAGAAAVHSPGLQPMNVQRMTFNSSYDTKTVDAEMAKAQESGRFMPFDSKTTTNWQYMATHEYGHAVQRHILHKLGGSWKSESEVDEMAQTHKDKILVKSLKYVKDSGSFISKYAASSPYEFFAEAFANAHGGSPNGVGLGMRDFLTDVKKQGLL